MKYSDFVKEQMAKMSGSNIKASEKMKMIGQKWAETKGTKASMPKASMPKASMPKEETDIEKMVKLLGGKKSKAAGVKVIKAVKKMKEPFENSVKSSEMGQLVQEIKQIEETPKEEHNSSMSHHHGLGF
jgi:hypothetical protein